MFHVNITLVLKNIHALRDIYDLRLHYFAQYCCCIPVYTYLAWSGTPALLQTQKERFWLKRSVYASATKWPLY